MATTAGAETGSTAAPLSERFDLEAVILGLAADLDALRAGDISVHDARVRAEMAKQIMNGVRLVVNAQRFLEERAKYLPPAAEGKEAE